MNAVPSTERVLVAGVGMTPFVKPGQGPTYVEMARTAAREALADAGVEFEDIEQTYAAYVHAESTAGQQVTAGLGLTGRPAFNVNNNCATGSSALMLARQAIASGAADCVLVVGFEQMRAGALGAVYPDLPHPLDVFESRARALGFADDGMPLTVRFFGAAGLTAMRDHGVSLQTFAEIRAKASRHAANNPYAVFRRVLTADDVLSAPALWPGVMTRPMACPPTSGAAAVVLVSPAFARRRGMPARICILAQAMATDNPATFSGDMRHLVGADMSTRAAEAVYRQAGIAPGDVDVIELHDCFAQNELLTYEALGLCGAGEGERFVREGRNTYGGDVVVNPSGGLLSKGHPLGATGVAQCVELTWQLNGRAQGRQVEGCRLALQHNIGLGGACVVTLYERLPW